MMQFFNRIDDKGRFIGLKIAIGDPGQYDSHTVSYLGARKLYAQMETQGFDRSPLFVIHGVSGSGKSTLINQYRKVYPKRTYQIKKDTTRPKRPDEDGIDFNFVKTLSGNYVGTYERYGYEYGVPIFSDLHPGNINFLIIRDLNLMKEIKSNDVKIAFIHAPMDKLKQRMLQQGTNNIDDRLKRAELEVAEFYSNQDLFDFELFNYNNVNAMFQQFEGFRKRCLSE